MSAPDLRERLRVAGVVPVVEIEDAGRAAGLTGALLEGGLPAVEITLRTPAALEALAAACEAHRDALVGAGTIVEPEAVAQVVAAGACFGVSPGFDRDVVDAAAEAGLPLVPGAVTATELQACLRAGVELVKFFPAQTSGGVAALKALAGPFRSRGVGFMPTGGITEATLPEYLAVPSVVAVGGSWLTPAAEVAAGDWDAIRARAARATAVVREARA